MGKFGWIIFLIIIAANAIGPILKKREEQARKKRQSGAAPAAEAKPRSPAAQPHTTGPGSSRMEQLIARRQAQLEELRQRREQRRSAASLQARIGPASTPTTMPGPTPFRAPAPQPTRRVTRPTTAQPPASLPSAARPARTQPPQRRRVSEGPAAQPVERKRLTGLRAEPAASARPTAAPKPFLSLDARTITPQLLRRLVVLKEIFDPPIALRNRDIWDRAG